MNTGTVTLTERPLLILERRVDAERPLQALITEIAELGIATADVLEQLRVEYNAEEEQRGVLCYLIINVLYPAIAEASDDCVELMLALEERAKALLSKTLSADVHVDAYLEQEVSQQAVKQRLAIFARAKQKQLQELHNIANVTREEMRSSFESLKQRIILLARQREGAQEERAQRLDALSQKTERLVQRTHELARSAERVELGFGAQQQRLRDLHGS